MRNVSKALLWSAAGATMLLLAKSQSARQFHLAGKVVLITGGSRGLGLVLARHAAAEGARIAICARDHEELDRAEHELRAKGADVFAVACDLRKQEEAEQMARRVIDHFGAIDVLINNAGMIRVAPFEEMTIQDFHDAMDSNFWAGVYTTFAVLPEMRKRGSGRIVNVTSIGGRVAPPHLLPYAASKFAAVGFSRGLRSELLKDGIVVTTIVPGLMRTGSPRNAEFKGQNELEHAWFNIADSMPLASIDADRAGSEILQAAKRGDVELVLSLPAKIAVAADALFPEIMGGVFAAANHFLPGPGGIGKDIAKGKDSASSAAPSLLTTLSDRAAERNNEIG